MKDLGVCTKFVTVDNKGVVVILDKINDLLPGMDFPIWALSISGGMCDWDLLGAISAVPRGGGGDSVGCNVGASWSQDCRLPNM